MWFLKWFLEWQGNLEQKTYRGQGSCHRITSEPNRFINFQYMAMTLRREKNSSKFRHFSSLVTQTVSHLLKDVAVLMKRLIALLHTLPIQDRSPRICSQLDQTY